MSGPGDRAHGPGAWPTLRRSVDNVQPTTPEPDRPSRAKMTIRVYTVNRAGVVSKPRATVTVPYDDTSAPPLMGLGPLPPCACPRCRKPGAVR
jgi:hypothetical protein